MAVVQRSVLVEFSVGEMYGLVDDIESYPLFLPWCSGAEIVSRTSEQVVATIHMDFRGLKQHFTTSNSRHPYECIRLDLVSGPFRKLEGEWRFQALDSRACKVTLNLNYEFSGGLLDKMLGPVFHHIADNLVDAFVARAESVHGRR